MRKEVRKWESKKYKLRGRKLEKGTVRKRNLEREESQVVSMIILFQFSQVIEEQRP